MICFFFGAESLNCAQLGDDVNNLRHCDDLMGVESGCKRKSLIVYWAKCKLCKHLPLFVGEDEKRLWYANNKDN